MQSSQNIGQVEVGFEEALDDFLAHLRAEPRLEAQYQIFDPEKGYFMDFGTGFGWSPHTFVAENLLPKRNRCVAYHGEDEGRHSYTFESYDGDTLLISVNVEFTRTQTASSAE